MKYFYKNISLLWLLLLASLSAEGQQSYWHKVEFDSQRSSSVTASTLRRYSLTNWRKNIRLYSLLKG